MASMATYTLRLNRTTHIFMIITLWLIFGSFQTHAGYENLGLIWAETLEYDAKTGALGDFFGLGYQDLVLASVDNLTVYRWEPLTESYRFSFSQSNFSAPLAVLASADTYFDGTSELWIGTEGSGAIYIYQVNENGLDMLCLVGRLWSSVAKIIPLDINTDNRTDLLAISSAGQASLFINNGNYTFTQIWRTPANTSPDMYIAYGDVDGDAVLEMVVGKKQGYFAVYKWIFGITDNQNTTSGELKKIAENYPWGAVEFVEMTDINNDGCTDILIGTDLNRLYGYTWNGFSFSLEWQWPLDKWNTPQVLPSGQTSTALKMLDTENNSLIIYAFDNTEQKNIWKSSLPVTVFTYSDQRIITFYQNQVTVLGLEQEGIFIKDSQGRYLPNNLPLVRDDVLWLEWSDWRDLLSLRMWVSEEGSRLSGVGPGFQLYSMQAGQNILRLNGKNVTLDNPAMILDGRLYVPIDFAIALGYKLQWHPDLRALYVDQL